MVDGVVHSDHECAAQLKAIVGQYARVLYERVGADAFGQECSLLDGKGAWRLQFVQSRRRSYTSRKVTDCLTRGVLCCLPCVDRTGIPAKCSCDNSRFVKLIAHFEPESSRADTEW